jgi:hypothetical protein
MAGLKSGAIKVACGVGFAALVVGTSFWVAPEWSREVAETTCKNVKDSIPAVKILGGKAINTLREHIPLAIEDFSDTLSDNKANTCKLFGGLATAFAAVLVVGNAIKDKGYNNRGKYR